MSNFSSNYILKTIEIVQCHNAIITNINIYKYLINNYAINYKTILPFTDGDVYTVEHFTAYEYVKTFTNVENLTKINR